MIVAERKPMEELIDSLSQHQKVMLLGCRGCVTVCLAGGEREVAVLASQLTMARQKAGHPIQIIEATIERQCDYEYFDKLRHEVDTVEAILSLACGAGVQAAADKFPDTLIYPALNTKFLGVTLKAGAWAERCQGCGRCVLQLTGGVCPVARCSKSHFNGPCGGSQGGKCEVSDDIDCGWQLIYERLKRLGQLHRLQEIEPPKDWSTSRDGGPRKLVREDMLDESGE